jgi:cell division protein FtsW (lipid II flippase)
VILACQFVAAWGNMLGLLPVVGQPMTFVSMAGSHHFGFAAPAVMLTVVVAMLTGEAGLAAGRPRPLIGPGSGTLFLTT